MRSSLCQRLLSEGYRVVCMDNLRTDSYENIAHLKGSPDFEYVDHDTSSTPTDGPKMRLDDERMIPNFVSQALAGEHLTVHVGGSQTRSVQYVDDLSARC